VFDGNSSGSDSIMLPILTQDDNPTMVCIHVARQPEPYSAFLVHLCISHTHNTYIHYTQTYVHTACMCNIYEPSMHTANIDMLPQVSNWSRNSANRSDAFTPFRL